MARSKTVADTAVLDATLVVISRQGPAGLTFALVGKEAGLSPATLVQRFGTRDALIHAALLLAWDRLDDLTAEEDAIQSEDVDGAILLLEKLSPTDGDATIYVDGPLLLRGDVGDPVLRARGAAWLDGLALALGRRLTSDPRARRPLGRMLACQWQGAQVWWAFNRRGEPRETVSKDLRAWCDVVLKHDDAA